MTQTKSELLQTRHQGDIRLGDADSSHYVGFKAPATVGTSLVWTLPAADGTANYLLKTDGSGNLGWVADSSTDSTKMPLAGGIFTGDVTFDGATAGRDIVFDRSDNALEFADNAKATFGDSGDLAIWHNSSDNFIDTKWNLTIRKDDGAETLAKFNNNGAVELFYDNVKTFQTITHGIQVQGAEGQNAEVFINADEGDDDNDKWKFVAFNGEGALRFYNYTSGGWEQNIGMLGNGAVELYHDNVQAFATISEGVKLIGGRSNDSPAKLQIHSEDTSIVAGDHIGEIRFTGRDQAGAGTQAVGALIDVTAAANWDTSNSGYHSANIDFHTQDNSGTDTVAAGPRMRIDSTGHVGLGTISPTSFNANADDLVISKSGSSGITISTPNDAIGRIAFGDPEDNNVGEVRYHHSDNNLQFTVNAGEKLRIASSGQIGIAGANYGTSGQVLTSGGSGAAVSWTTIAGGLSSDAQKNTVGGTNAGNSFTGTDANDNTLIGYDAGTGITTGDKNTSLGVRANEQGTTGSANTAIGYEALRKLTDGGNNVAVGNNAGFELATGGRNVAIGAQCLKESTAGTGTVAMGWQASQENRGSYNVAIGYEALKGTGGVTGGNNVAIGSEAGKAVTSGDQNVMLGRLAGNGVTTGAHNVLIGAEAGTGNSPSGNVTAGTGIFCLGDAEISALYCMDTSISSSDSRDKADITNFTHGLSWINKLNPVTYRWDKRTWYNEYNEDGSLKTEGTRDGSKKKTRQNIGFLAQDVLAIEQADGFANTKDNMLVVNLNEDDTAYGLKYERLVPVLVNAIKELSTEVNTLKTKVAALEAA